MKPIHVIVLEMGGEFSTCSIDAYPLGTFKKLSTMAKAIHNHLEGIKLENGHLIDNSAYKLYEGTRPIGLLCMADIAEPYLDVAGMESQIETEIALCSVT